MKKLFLLLITTLFMLTSCDLDFNKPEFDGTWEFILDTPGEYLPQGVSGKNGIQMEFTKSNFKSRSVVYLSGDQDKIDGYLGILPAFYDISGNTVKVDINKGTIDSYTKTEFTMTITHLLDFRSGSGDLVETSGELAKPQTFSWSVSGDKLTIENSSGSTVYTRK